MTTDTFFSHLHPARGFRLSPSIPVALGFAFVLSFAVFTAPAVVRAAQFARFDAAPFGLPLPEGNGVLWEDPREVHQVVVQFEGAPPPTNEVGIEYWGSRWPEQRLPKDREPGGGDVGWMELGNWYNGGWRRADTDVMAEGSSLTFSFRPLQLKEFPGLRDYPATFRYTLKLRISVGSQYKIRQIQAFTDSVIQDRSIRLTWAWPQSGKLQFTAFNGAIKSVDAPSSQERSVTAATSVNPDPNTFDRTIITVNADTNVFSFAVDDLGQGPLFMPGFGVAILPATDPRSYAEVAAEVSAKHLKTLYQRISELPEQTWVSAWSNMPPKKSRIYFPLGLDGGRQRFLLEANGTVRFRLNDHFLQDRPGRDTPRLELEPGPVQFRFGPPRVPTSRTLEEESLPICETVWDDNGLRISETAFVTELKGTKASAPAPGGDTSTVFLARYTVINIGSAPLTPSLPLQFLAGTNAQVLRADDAGRLWLGDKLRGQVAFEPKSRGHLAATNQHDVVWSCLLQPGEGAAVVVKLPYLLLTEKDEAKALSRLDFDNERVAVGNYWRRRLGEGSQLVTPEPMLNQFYRSQAGHLLVNCEREPGSDRRFARVGSFTYGVYGNESCMMVVELDRRGYAREAQACLDAWLKYQGTVGLPGDFDSKVGVLYGAGGYEAGGYNQHHGWILWCLAEHFRFTRDETWLRRAAPGIVAGAEWIIRQAQRTADRPEIERGLLPGGDLEDIGDWWPWLSTSCYTWRGLDSAAWALEQIHHPEAPRIRAAAERYHASLLTNFRLAAQRSPVVRLRDGTAVPHFPSQVHRRGRSFGWICETLEGALHLLITGALDPRSPEAEWILKDYEDNLYLSNQYGYTVSNFDQEWFNRGGMSMQACLLLDVEPYLYRDDVKQALRALFNAESATYFPDVHMNTEHALPNLGDWRGDHFKTSDESNACGWLRQLFVREQGNELLLGQAVPREWLKPGALCGLSRAETYFGQVSVKYEGGNNEISAQVAAPRRNLPKQIRIRFHTPNGGPIIAVKVNGRAYNQFKDDWVQLPGNADSFHLVTEY